MYIEDTFAANAEFPWKNIQITLFSVTATIESGLLQS